MSKRTPNELAAEVNEARKHWAGGCDCDERGDFCLAYALSWGEFTLPYRQAMGMVSTPGQVEAGARQWDRLVGAGLTGDTDY